jgi:ADP-ribose pyrophosphatase YjhB (NUDIX family)
VDEVNYCLRCGTKLHRITALNETGQRLACSSCHFIHYENPKIIVGCLVINGNRILMCQRAIEPSHGLWTPPAGFLENQESLEMGAVREVREETGVLLDPESLIPHVITSLIDCQQVYILFRANTGSSTPAAGPESLKAEFFARSEVPWDQLAFRGMRQYLELAFEEIQNERFSIHVSKIESTRFRRRSFPVSDDNRAKAGFLGSS